MGGTFDPDPLRAPRRRRGGARPVQPGPGDLHAHRPARASRRTGRSRPPEHRYLMTVLATASNPDFEVSRLEIERPGPDLHRRHPALAAETATVPQPTCSSSPARTPCGRSSDVEGRRAVRGPVHVHRRDAARLRAGPGPARRTTQTRARAGSASSTWRCRPSPSRRPTSGSGCGRGGPYATSCPNPWPPTSLRTVCTVSPEPELLAAARSCVRA